jgi:lipopolysaccharide biosynthesis glycosyltransferase
LLLQDIEMEVLCACDQRYFPHAGTMLCSLLEHNNVSGIHLFYHSVTDLELVKLESFVSKYGAKITFYEMALTDFEGLHIDKWASAAVYFRLLAPRFLPIELDKILYLDSDIIVRRSLASLWNTDITGYALAAVPNHEDNARKLLGFPEGAKYFNSGVLLLNLHFWKENQVVENAIAFIRNNPGKVHFWDQDALNATLIDKWVELPTCWNWQLNSTPLKPGIEPGPAIVHFLTDDKPWHSFGTHLLKGEYYKYRRKTPWRQFMPLNVPPGISRSIRNFARMALPSNLRVWLRTRFS